MLNYNGPVVVDFVVEPNEHVYPMVPAGKGLHEQVLGVVDQQGGKVEERLRQMMDQQEDLGTLA